MKALLPCSFFAVWLSCTTVNPQAGQASYVCVKDSSSLQYLFLGHIYRWYTTDRIDERIEKLDKTCFDQVWLGGDLTPETTREPATVHYLDSIFHLQSLESYWAVGNHDIRNGHMERITGTTGRPTFYAHYNRNGFTVIVLNTVLYQIYEDDSVTHCLESQKQLDLIRNVCDTIEKSSHLFLLMHHVLWHGIDLYTWMYGNHIHEKWRVFCDSNSTFEQEIYPLLEKVQSRGVQVFCIAGDGGLRDRGQSKKFGLHITRDGVVLMASGINNSKYTPEQQDTVMKDKVLVLYHDTSERQITYRFHDLDSLLAAQKQFH